MGHFGIKKMGTLIRYLHEQCDHMLQCNIVLTVIPVIPKKCNTDNHVGCQASLFY